MRPIIFIYILSLLSCQNFPPDEFGVFTPEHYGAKGDGLTDDTDAINEMFDSLLVFYNDNISPRVEFRNARYYTKGVEYKGLDPRYNNTEFSVNFNDATLVCDSANWALYFKHGGRDAQTAEGRQYYRLKLRNLRIQGTAPGAKGIYFSGIGNSVFQNLTLIGCDTAAAFYGPFYRNVIENVLIDRLGACGILLSDGNEIYPGSPVGSAGANFNTIQDCQIFASSDIQAGTVTRFAIDLWRTQKTAVDHVSIEGRNPEYAVRIQTGGCATCQDNSVNNIWYESLPWPGVPSNTLFWLPDCGSLLRITGVNFGGDTKAKDTLLRIDKQTDGWILLDNVEAARIVRTDGQKVENVQWHYYFEDPYTGSWDNFFTSWFKPGYFESVVVLAGNQVISSGPVSRSVASDGRDVNRRIYEKGNLIFTANDGIKRIGIVAGTVNGEKFRPYGGYAGKEGWNTTLSGRFGWTSTGDYLGFSGDVPVNYSITLDTAGAGRMKFNMGQNSAGVLSSGQLFSNGLLLRQDEGCYQLIIDNSGAVLAVPANCPDE